MIRKMEYQDIYVKLHERNEKEILLGSGMDDTSDFLYMIYEQIPHKWVCEQNGKPICLFGVNDSGYCYLFFGEIESLPLSFYKEMKGIIDEQLDRIGVLRSTILIENEFALKLAKFYGATFSKEYTDNGVDVVDFEIKRK